jgi:hypothetical protein
MSASGRSRGKNPFEPCHLFSILRFQDFAGDLGLAFGSALARLGMG